MKVENYIDVLKSFLGEKIDFMVIGGFAVVAHGVIRTTVDLDLAIGLDGDNLHRAWNLLLKLGFVTRQPVDPSLAIDPTQFKKFMDTKNAKALSFYVLSKPFIIVDLLWHEDVKPSATNKEQKEIFGLLCPVVTKSELIKIKEAAARPKDLLDATELKKI